MTIQRLPATAIANAAGVATFTFTPCPQGQVMTGTVAVPGAGNLVSSNVVIGGTTYAPFLGANPYGPVQLIGGETLTVVSNGLKPSTQYICIWLADIEPANQAGSGQLIPYGSSVVSAQGIPGGAAISISDSFATLLVPTNIPTLAATAQTLTPLGPALQDFDVIEVISIGASSPSFQFPIAVAITNETQGFTTPQQTALAPDIAASQVSYYLPCPTQTGDVLELRTRGSQASAGTEFMVIGHGKYGPVELRGDGRRLPSGMYVVDGIVSGAGSGTLIAAPGVNLSILIHTLRVYFSGAPPDSGEVIGTVRAATSPLAFPAVGQTAASVTDPLAYPGGLLMDPNTAVTLTVNSGGSLVAVVSYDIVF